MARTKKKTSTSNSTKDKLAGTPFSNMSEMSAASDELRRETWSQLERARIKKELLQKAEYQFFLDPFKKGMICKYGEKNDNLVRVFLDEEGGIEVNINEEMKSAENSGALLSALIKSTSDSLFSNYLKSMDIISLNDQNSDQEVVNKIKKKPLKK